MRSLFAAVLAAVLLAPLALSAVEGPQFEVASVKPNPALDAGETVTIEPNGGIRMVGYRVINLILGAYDMRQIQMRDQIIGGPSWIFIDRFDIVAKAEGTLTFDAQGRRPAEALTMLKGLLEDRFAVRVHTETRPMRAFALSLAQRDRNLGPKLTESASDCPKYGAGEAAPSVQASAERWCGFRRLPGRVEGKSVTMSEVASYFAAAAAIRRPVEDRTKLTGRYDFSVEYPDVTDAETTSSFFTAFREQLGLKFDQVRTQVPVLVIDRVQRPTAD